MAHYTHGPVPGLSFSKNHRLRATWPLSPESGGLTHRQNLCFLLGRSEDTTHREAVPWPGDTHTEKAAAGPKPKLVVVGGGC